MLRHEILTNFIHFQDHQKLDFQPGCNFFIGQNSSGKTSVFEAARRCGSTRQSTSLSSPHFPDKLSAATCVFYEETDNNTQKFFSSIIRLPTLETLVQESEVYVKIAFESKNNSFGIDLVKETQDTSKILVNEKVNVDLQRATAVKEKCANFLQFDKSPNEQILTELFDIVQGCIPEEDVNAFKSSKEQKIQDDSECELLLRNHVDKGMVFTFSVRGIGPCQWSRSPRVTNDYKTKNYNEAQERAEILKWYLSEVKSNNIGEDEQLMVKTIFDTVTNHSGFEFSIIEGSNEAKDGLVAYNRKAGKRSYGKDDTKPLAIMKVPEGILEAMNSSILLGVSCFKSVCLEEPEKGMHPQMIERMRDLVLKNVTGKTVLITSHHPSLLGPWTVPRLYIFRRSENRNGVSFKVFSGTQIEQSDSDKKTPRIITSEHFSSLFFAKRVLFVEGDGDYLFMTTLKHLLLTIDDLVKTLVSKEVEQFRVFLCSLQIINLNGETLKLRFNRLCSSIDLERYFLLDFDAIEDHEKKANKFLENFSIQHLEPDKVLADVSLLQQEGLFVWNKCKIEDVLIELSTRYSDLKEFFGRNNVLLKYNPETKMQNRYKLFRNKEVTDENITNVVERVLKCCVQDKRESRNTELLRLLQFLGTCSESSQSHSLGH